MKIDLSYIREIATIMEDKSLVEVAIEDGEQKLSLKKGIATPAISTVITKQDTVASVPTEPSEVITQAAPAKSSTATAVTSPMVGTFYVASSPDAEPFVKVGDVVSKGQIVCIIEAMKLMNEIEAEVSGKIVEICVENGQTIEFGQVLMYIE